MKTFAESCVQLEYFAELAQHRGRVDENILSTLTGAVSTMISSVRGAAGTVMGLFRSGGPEAVQQATAQADAQLAAMEQEAMDQGAQGAEQDQGAGGWLFDKLMTTVRGIVSVFRNSRAVQVLTLGVGAVATVAIARTFAGEALIEFVRRARRWIAAGQQSAADEINAAMEPRELNMGPTSQSFGAKEPSAFDNYMVPVAPGTSALDRYSAPPGAADRFLGPAPGN